jgi:hypothetical protein
MKLNKTEPLSIEDVLKQSRSQGREPVILEKGKQELMSFSAYTKEFDLMLSLLDDAKKCVSNDLKEASLLILDNISEWLEEVYKRANGDFTNYLHRD